MSFFPDMGTVTMAAAGTHVRAVGWLDPDHAFSTGIPPSGFLGRLKKFARECDKSAELLGLPRFLGSHTCEFCGEASGAGSFGVPERELLFVAPDLIAHYVAAHRYLPPAEFVTAVLQSPAFGTERYGALVERFRRLPISPEDRQRIGDSGRAWSLRTRRGRSAAEARALAGHDNDRDR